MTVTGAVSVAIGATAGSVARYLSGMRLSRISRSPFPWATWSVNAIGCLLLGLFFRVLTNTHRAGDGWLFLGIGFCGGYTTFSTLSVEMVHLVRTHKRLAIVYVASSICVGCVLTWIGVFLL
ncbi:fluoride efflux transporter CrcB [Alicyclobacillus macrosporangiidus]|uniref:Fluoride-specific ion channel FluC n=1 Tax=Alicyclobacillus macrosporangiidus TaxID=392015 RepID=A0A1I7JBT9_9BACL|nr:fluoride efflux transporter CrcB [Alicyclobacillus macrosporangiidus]SFU82665.1 CrcB protein [Alicyclobacillus macrosporangiidus]